MMKHTLTAVPAKAPGDVRGLDGLLVTGLHGEEEPLQLVRDILVQAAIVPIIASPSGKRKHILKTA